MLIWLQAYKWRDPFFDFSLPEKRIQDLISAK